MKLMILAAMCVLAGCYGTGPESRVQSRQTDTIPMPDVGLPSYSEQIDLKITYAMYDSGYVVWDGNEDLCDSVWQAVKDDARRGGGDSLAIDAAVHRFIFNDVCVEVLRGDELSMHGVATP